MSLYLQGRLVDIGLFVSRWTRTPRKTQPWQV